MSYPTSDLALYRKGVRDALYDLTEREVADKLWEIGQSIPDIGEQADFFTAVLSDLASIGDGLQPIALANEGKYKWQPVGIHEFITSAYYLNKAEEVFPKVLEELEAMNSGDYQEIVLTGGIGSAKTTCALYTLAYQLYLMSCLNEPHKVFGLDSVSEILIVFQSLNKKTANSSYTRFRMLIGGSQYFQEKFPFDKMLTSQMNFPHRISVVPVSGAESAVIGQNVIGGLIDELNYMSVVEKSKQSVDAGQYDQAVALYNSIARRRMSRFLSHGRMPGVLCLVSSKRYPGQFTDTKEAERAKDIGRTGKSSIYLYDYRVWDVKPEGSFGPERFFVFAGDESRKPRLLQENEEIPPADSHLVVAVPMEFLNEFEKDIINALREIAGVSTLARHPYFVDVESVANAFGQHPSIFSREEVDFIETQLMFYPKHFWRPELPRFAHIDLGITGDSAGLTIGCVSGFRSMKALGFSSSEEEFMPTIRIDGVLEVKPPKHGEILFWKIRDVLVKLRDSGMNIRWVSFDSFQSRDSLQLLKQQGFVVGEFSMDKDTKGYDTLKSCIYTNRLSAPQHIKCRKELVALEKDTKTGKIDHPISGSKDCSDSLAGVVHGLTTRREVWGMFGIPLMQVPNSVQTVAGPKDEKPIPPDDPNYRYDAAKELRRSQAA